MDDQGHTVEIDEKAADDIFNAYAEGEYIPADRQLPPPGGGGEESSNGWEKPATFLADFLDKKICPNWGVDDDTKEQWALALAETLDDLFPGGLGNFDNWSPWKKLLFATSMWTMCGIDFETLTFKPLHPPKEEDGTGNHEGDEPPQQQHRQRPSGGFKIG